MTNENNNATDCCDRNICNKIICGDALEVLRSLPDQCADMCLTSPPYYGLRDYGCDRQIGLEQSPDEYVERLVTVFREVRRVLADTGVFWLNIADSYAGSSKGAVKPEKLPSFTTKQRYKFTTTDPAAQLPKQWANARIKPKDLIGIPWKLAFALRDDGWYLRSCVLWEKPNAMPESSKDRPTRSYEHVFLLAKSPKYYYDGAAIAEPVAPGTIDRKARAVSDANKYARAAPGQTAQSLSRARERMTAEEIAKLPTTRNSRDIWRISTRAYKGTHFATFPVELARRCILAGCPMGGVVLDPFFGAGTTGVAAIENGRRYIGVELNAEFCRLAEERLQKAEKAANTANTADAADNAVSATQKSDI